MVVHKFCSKFAYCSDNWKEKWVHFLNDKKMIKYKDVKNKCSEGRFFSYDDWRDKLFVPPSIF